MEAKRDNGKFQLTCIYCNPSKGRGDLEDSSFIEKDEHEVCQLTRTKVQGK
jgi:hypothetical protein